MLGFASSSQRSMATAVTQDVSSGERCEAGSTVRWLQLSQSREEAPHKLFIKVLHRQIIAMLGSKAQNPV